MSLPPGAQNNSLGHRLHLGSFSTVPHPRALSHSPPEPFHQRPCSAASCMLAGSATNQQGYLANPALGFIGWEHAGNLATNARHPPPSPAPALLWSTLFTKPVLARCGEIPDSNTAIKEFSPFASLLPVHACVHAIPDHSMKAGCSE